MRLLKRRRILYAAALASIVTFLGIVTYLRHSTVPLAAELTENQFFDLINVTYGPERLLQSIAFNKKFSIEVIDRLESNGKRMAVFRVLAADLGSETTILLRTPEIFHKSNIDTTRWDIDWTYLPAGSYYQAMVASMFKSGAVAFTLKSEANVLCIGLGGGSINGFLHHVFPKMHITVVESEPRMVLIAKRWFGLQLDDRHRLEVNDGLKFIADRARSGSTYDAILLDACENDTTAKNLCPLEGFLNETIIKDLVLLTSDRGVLILNAISFVYPKEQVRQRLLSRFVKHFKYCYVDDMDYWLNLKRPKTTTPTPHIVPRLQQGTATSVLHAADPPSLALPRNQFVFSAEVVRALSEHIFIVATYFHAHNVPEMWIISMSSNLLTLP